MSFDELYEESKQLSQAVQKNAITDRAEKVAHELESYGFYQYLKTSVKADAFKFDVSGASGNLRLFINVHLRKSVIFLWKNARLYGNI